MVFMANSTDHVTGKASLTLTITASKDGGAYASISPTVTERGDGMYSLTLTTSHTDTLGDLALHITGTGADPTDVIFQVVAFDFTVALATASALPSAATTAAAVLAAEVHTGYSLSRCIKIIGGATGGKASGAANNQTIFRFLDDSGDAITTVTDDYGNRTTATHGS